MRLGFVCFSAEPSKKDEKRDPLGHVDRMHVITSRSNGRTSRFGSLNNSVRNIDPSLRRGYRKEGTKPMGQRETGCYIVRTYIWERKADRNVRISIEMSRCSADHARSRVQNGWSLKLASERNETIPDRTLPSLPMPCFHSP